MGVRESLNRSPLIAVAVLVIAAVAVYLGVQVTGSQEGAIATGGYFTVDDGKTWFSAGLENTPPFDRGGKPAVRAHVFRCDGREFVGYMEQFGPQAIKVLNDLKARNEMNNTAAVAAIYESGLQVKKPGDARWVAMNSPEGQAMRVVTCGNGQPAEIVRP